MCDFTMSAIWMFQCKNKESDSHDNKPPSWF